METIKDILDEIREIADAGNGHISIHAPTFADRIEQAVTNCNQLKMREALQRAVDWFNTGGFEDGVVEEMDSMIEYAETALSAPPRNCDRFNAPDEAISAYCEDKGITHPLPLWFGNEFWRMLQWLFAETKGESK